MGLLLEDLFNFCDYQLEKFNPGIIPLESNSNTKNHNNSNDILSTNYQTPKVFIKNTPPSKLGSMIVVLHRMIRFPFSLNVRLLFKYPKSYNLMFFLF